MTTNHQATDIAILQDVFKDYELNCRLSENGDAIIIGGTFISRNSILFKIVLPFLCSLVLLAVFVFVTSRGTNYLLLASVAWFLGGIISIRMKAGRNKDKKVFGKDQITISGEKGTKSFKLAAIKKLHPNVKMIANDPTDIEGYLFLEDVDGERHLLLGLFGKNKQKVAKDLDYIIKVLESFTGIAPSN